MYEFRLALALTLALLNTQILAAKLPCEETVDADVEVAEPYQGLEVFPLLSGLNIAEPPRQYSLNLTSLIINRLHQIFTEFIESHSLAETRFIREHLGPFVDMEVHPERFYTTEEFKKIAPMLAKFIRDAQSGLALDVFAGRSTITLLGYAGMRNYDELVTLLENPSNAFRKNSEDYLNKSVFLGLDFLRMSLRYALNHYYVVGLQRFHLRVEEFLHAYGTMVLHRAPRELQVHNDTFKAASGAEGKQSVESLLEAIRKKFDLTALQEALIFGHAGKAVSEVDERSGTTYYLPERHDLTIIKGYRKSVIDAALESLKRKINSGDYQGIFTLQGRVLTPRELINHRIEKLNNVWDRFNTRLGTSLGTFPLAPLPPVFEVADVAKHLQDMAIVMARLCEVFNEVLDVNLASDRFWLGVFPHFTNTELRTSTANFSDALRYYNPRSGVNRVVILDHYRFDIVIGELLGGGG